MAPLALLLLLIRLILILLVLAAALVYAAWQYRVPLVSIAAKRAAKMDARVDDVSLKWTLAADITGRLRAADAPVDAVVVVVSLAQVATAFDPANAAACLEQGTTEELLQIRRVEIRLGRSGVRSFRADVVVEGLSARFVAYDYRFKDTNVQRLITSLSSTKEAEPEAPAAELEAEATPAAPAAASPPSAVQLCTVELVDARVHLMVNLSGAPGGEVAVVPPIHITKERIDLTKIKGSTPVYLLLWVNGVALRALAGSSVEALRSGLNNATRVAAHAIDSSLAAVDELSKQLPGSAVLTSTTGAARGLVHGIEDSTGAIVDASASAVKHISAALTAGDVNDSVESIRQGFAATLTGVEQAGGTLLDSVSESLGFGSNVTGCAKSVITGVTTGGTQAVGGVLGGTVDLAKGVVTADMASACAGGKAMVGGVAQGVASVAGGVGSGAAVLVHGSGEKAAAPAASPKFFAKFKLPGFGSKKGKKQA